MTDAVNQKRVASWFGRKDFVMNNAADSEGGILARILDAIFESHESQADREIIPFVAQSGEAFTDDRARDHAACFNRQFDPSLVRRNTGLLRRYAPDDLLAPAKLPFSKL
jgi:hypothetical protein